VIGADTPDPWAAIGAFLAVHRGEPVAGYLGFDLHAPGPHPGGWPAAVLFVPRSWELVGPEGAPEVGGPCRCAEAHHAPAKAHDRRDEVAWERLAEAALRFVGREPARRLTLARRVVLPPTAEALAAFRWGAAGVPEARVV